MAMPPPMTSSTDERASSPPDIDGMCSSYASCHTTRVFIAIQSRLGRSEQRSLVRRTWLKWAKRYNKDNVEHGSQRVPIAWRFFLHGSVGITNETSKEPLMQTELRVEKDLVLASMKLHNQPKAPRPTMSSRSSYASPYSSRSSLYSRSSPAYNSSFANQHNRAQPSSTHSSRRLLSEAWNNLASKSISSATTATTTEETHLTYVAVDCTAAERSAWSQKVNRDTASFLTKKKELEVPCSVVRWAPEAQQVAWALNSVDFEYFLHVSDSGLLCVDWLMEELKYRPSERFLWGKFNCMSRERSPPAMDSSFVLMSRDVAEWWLRLQGMYLGSGALDPLSETRIREGGVYGDGSIGLDSDGFGGARFQSGASSYAPSHGWKLEPPRKPIPLDKLATLLGTPLVLDDQQRLVGPHSSSAFLEDYREDVQKTKASRKAVAALSNGYSSTYRSRLAKYSQRRLLDAQGIEFPRADARNSTLIYRNSTVTRFSRFPSSRARIYSPYSRNSTFSYRNITRSRFSWHSGSSSSRSHPPYLKKPPEKPLGPVFCHRFMWASDLDRSIIPPEGLPERQHLRTYSTTWKSSAFREPTAIDSTNRTAPAAAEPTPAKYHNTGDSKEASSPPATTASPVHSSTEDSSHTTFLSRFFGIGPLLVPGSAAKINSTSSGASSPSDEGELYEYGISEKRRRLMSDIDVDEDDDPIVNEAAAHQGRSHLEPLRLPDESSSTANSALDALLVPATGSAPSNYGTKRLYNSRLGRSHLTKHALSNTQQALPLPKLNILDALYQTMTDSTIDWTVPKRNYAILGSLCSPPPRRPDVSEVEVLQAARYAVLNALDQGGEKSMTPQELEPWDTFPLHVHTEILGRLLDLQKIFRAQSLEALETALQTERLRRTRSWGWMLRGSASSPERRLAEARVVAERKEDEALQKGLFACDLDVACMWAILRKAGIVQKIWFTVDARRSLRCCGPKSVAFLDKCGRLRDRTLIPGNEQRSGHRTVLASFPGSGNTWARLLLEYGSGYLSGSTYDDVDLVHLMPAEGRDDSAVVVVKTHTAPRTFMPRVRPQKVIFLVRHPLNAIWAEFQRRRLNDHTGAMTLNFTSSYARSKVLRVDLPKFASCMACKWMQFAAAHTHLSSSTDVTLRVVRYEDLQKNTVGVLQGLLSFVFNGQSSSSVAQPQWSEPERLQCAAQLANRNSIHRTKKISAQALYTEYPYIACDAWEVLIASPASRLLLSTFGYENYVNKDGGVCTSSRGDGYSGFSTVRFFNRAPCSLHFDDTKTLKSC